MEKIERKYRFFRGDIVILILVFFFSIISLYAASSSSNQMLDQLKHLALCYLAMFIFYKIDYQKLSKFSILFLLSAFAVLILTLTSADIHHRSLIIFGRKIQTFYFIGFIVIYFITKYLAVRANRNEELSGKEYSVLLGVLLFFCAGIFKGNFSTAIILFTTAMVVFFVANVKMRYILGSLALCLIGVLVIMNTDTNIGRGSTMKGRINYYIASKSDQKISEELADYGRQMILAKAAIARSTWTPTGPGQGVIKKKLAENDTDYVFATVVEEIGIIGGLVIILLYLILFYRTMRIARRSDGFFGRILAVGIGFWITCQALVHIAVNCELIPATGQTLPFISKGGASLLFTGIMIGMLLNISKNTQYNEI